MTFRVTIRKRKVHVHRETRQGQGLHLQRHYISHECFLSSESEVKFVHNEEKNSVLLILYRRNGCVVHGTYDLTLSVIQKGRLHFMMLKHGTC